MGQRAGMGNFQLPIHMTVRDAPFANRHRVRCRKWKGIRGEQSIDQSADGCLETVTDITSGRAFKVVTGDVRLQGVQLDFDVESRRALAIERLDLPLED